MSITEIFALIATFWPLLQHFSIPLVGVLGGALWYLYSPLGKSIGAIVAVVAVLATVAYSIGVYDGEANVRAQVAIHEAALTKAINDARAAAEKSVPPVVPLPAPSRPAAGVHNSRHRPLDKFDRG